MMPLWTTAMVPSMLLWGWAFSTEGAPWVAQRVCPMPTDPSIGSRTALSSTASLPLARTTFRFFPFWMQIPELS
jgi:hypothetical protein